MKNIFTIAAYCLQRDDIDEKLAVTRHAANAAQHNEINFCDVGDVLPISITAFPSRPVLLPPKEMPQRKLTNESGRAAFFHALAHIEFIAVYLAWDIVYRFRGLPEKFYLDWLQVADEEAQHFLLLRQHLRTMGVDYGDLPAHRGLWDHAEQTADDLLARLALVPRCLEARGLDVTPTMIEKFQAMEDPVSVEILTRILEDEVGHVKIGSFWFHFFCNERMVDSEIKFQELIGKFYKGKPKGPFNRELRIIAGFSKNEINWLERRTDE